MTELLTLAITKIGDILLNQTITCDSEGQSINEINLSIPEYQRPYKWTAKNANQLLDDILDARNDNKEVYRVGTLILHHDEEGRYCVVDGQQRVITFSLLLKAMDPTLEIQFLEQNVSNNSFNIRNISSNYRALVRRADSLRETNKVEYSEIIEYVKNNCEMIVVITTNISEAFQFFDSQNARGKKLYPHDLLKAYHLREMDDIDNMQIEKTVKVWEDMDQGKLSALFSDYLYRIKEWVKGNRPSELNEHNIDIFKGVSKRDNYPFAQYYKGAFSFADSINNSQLPFVTGIHKLTAFQIDSPIIAGTPFFDYTKHYFDILTDIQNNSKYEGCFINDNEIVKTLDLRQYRNGTGNRITRLLFDTAILLYVDRFCLESPSKTDIELLEQFVVYAFIWAYSLRAQYRNVGWLVAQNYVMGESSKDVQNSFNLYKVISDEDSPIALLSALADKVQMIHSDNVVASRDHIDETDKDGVCQNYLAFFIKYNFLEKKQ